MYCAINSALFIIFWACMSRTQGTQKCLNDLMDMKTMRVVIDMMHLHVSHTYWILTLVVFYVCLALLVPCKLPLCVSCCLCSLLSSDSSKHHKRGEKDSSKLKTAGRSR